MNIKEISLYGQILEREREREKEKEIESRRFHKIEGNFVPKSNISFDLDFDSKSFIPKKKIKSGDKKKDNALVASLVSHYNKQLLELKEMAKKKTKILMIKVMKEVHIMVNLQKVVIHHMFPKVRRMREKNLIIKKKIKI